MIHITKLYAHVPTNTPTQKADLEYLKGRLEALHGELELLTKDLVCSIHPKDKQEVVLILDESAMRQNNILSQLNICNCSDFKHLVEAKISEAALLSGGF